MCNYFEYKQLTLDDYFADFSEVRIPLRFDEGRIPNLLPSKDTVYPTNLVQAFRPLDPADPHQGVEAFQPRWGLVPGFWRKTVKEWKATCFNARSEDAAEKPAFRYAFKHRRCLIPATGFYDFTGPKGDKTRWLFKREGRKWFSFAGLWDRAETADGPVESCTLMTIAPGPDVAPYHHRQPVILEREDWARWLDVGADPAPLFEIPPGGRLTVEKASPLRREAAEV